VGTLHQVHASVFQHSGGNSQHNLFQFYFYCCVWEGCIQGTVRATLVARISAGSVRTCCSSQKFFISTKTEHQPARSATDKEDILVMVVVYVEILYVIDYPYINNREGSECGCCLCPIMLRKLTENLEASKIFHKLMVVNKSDVTAS